MLMGVPAGCESGQVWLPCLCRWAARAPVLLSAVQDATRGKPSESDRPTMAVGVASWVNRAPHRLTINTRTNRAGCTARAAGRLARVIDMSNSNPLRTS